MKLLRKLNDKLPSWMVGVITVVTIPVWAPIMVILSLFKVIVLLGECVKDDVSRQLEKFNDKS